MLLFYEGGSKVHAKISIMLQDFKEYSCLLLFFSIYTSPWKNNNKQLFPSYDSTAQLFVIVLGLLSLSAKLHEFQDLSMVLKYKTKNKYMNV